MPASARVLVDTSVWIDFLNGKPDVVQGLRTLMRSARIVICGQIKQEVLQGSRDSAAFTRLESELSIWEFEAEEPEDFVEGARIFASLRWKGITIPPSDCLIAAVARRRGLPLFASDVDFEHVPQLVLHHPFGTQ